MGEVQRLVENLVAMHEILRDRSAVSLRLVMTPDRMVVAEAMRTFTYLSLYGYLTDAVVVNRVFPEALDGTYFGAWRELQQRELERVRGGLRPRARAAGARTSTPRSSAPAMLDRLCDAVFGDGDPAALLHADLAQDFRLEDGRGEVRLAVPFAERGDVSLKKIGDELVVRVDGQKRTVVLPAALAALSPGRRRARRPARWWCALAETEPGSARVGARASRRGARRRGPARAGGAAPGRGVGRRGRGRDPAARLGAAPRAQPLPLPDLSALAALLDAVRSAVPPELSRQLAEALRDLLVALRALIDWYLQRLGEPGAPRRGPDRSRTSRWTDHGAT